MNRKICVISQTYSDNRHILFRFHNCDDNQIHFRNSFDKNIYSFHNCSDDYVNTILNFKFFKEIKNLEIVRYNDISYTETFKRTLQKCRAEKYDRVIFMQDDSYSQPEENTELVNFIKTGDYNMLNMEMTPLEITHVQSMPAVYTTDTLKIYPSTSRDFVLSGKWAFDDGCWAARLDYLSNIYDDMYFNIGDIWSGEIHLKNKIKNTVIDRFICSRSYFFRRAVVGKNVQPNNNDRDYMMNRFKRV